MYIIVQIYKKYIIIKIHKNNKNICNIKLNGPKEILKESGIIYYHVSIVKK